MKPSTEWFKNTFAKNVAVPTPTTTPAVSGGKQKGELPFLLFFFRGGYGY